MVHYFHSDIAQKYGYQCGRACGVHLGMYRGKSIRQPQLHEGKVWFRCSVQMLTGFFPYLSYDEIRYALKRLIKGVFLLRGISTKAALTARTGTHLLSWGNI